MYQDEENLGLPSAKSIFVGLGAVGAAAYMGRKLQTGAPEIANRLGRYQSIAGTSWFQKYKAQIGQPYNSKGHGFWNNFIGKKSGVPLREGSGFSISRNMSGKRVANVYSPRKMNETLAMFMPRSRPVQSWEKPIYKAMGKYPDRVMKSSMAGVFSIMQMNQSVDEYGLAGIPIGAARETGALLGGAFGGAMGHSLGHRLTKGLAGAAGAGKMVGMGVGAMAGFVAIDGLIRLSKLGKKWSTPELGGRYTSSDTSMTMMQRSMNSISTSQFNIRNSLGKEALSMHGLV